MNSATFERIFKEQNGRCEIMLCGKAKEYATDDERLHNFKVAAALQGITPIQALGGMMAKHTISVYDMCWSGKTYPLSLWEEKITDHLDYLHLLNALVRESIKAEREAHSDRAAFEKAMKNHLDYKKEQEIAEYARTILGRAEKAYNDAKERLNQREE